MSSGGVIAAGAGPRSSDGRRVRLAPGRSRGPRSRVLGIGGQRHVEQARAAVLDYFGGTKDYTAIFTLNASGALKLVGEAYPFAPGGRLLLTADNHNSVNGIREFAQSRGARVDYAPLTRP